MTDLSRAAQAALDAVEDDCIHPTDFHHIAAAALRAAADQVVPEMVNAVGDEHDDARREQWIRIRRKFLVLAAELEAQ